MLCAAKSSGTITSPVADYAKFSIGYVCGDKEFFHPTTTTINDKFGIRPENLHTVVRGARQLRGKGLYTSELPKEATAQLFLPSTDELSDGERRVCARGH